MSTFHKLRPPGHGIDSNTLRRGSPSALRKKVSRKTILRRLADKGYTMQDKESKTDLGVVTTKKRMVFSRKHQHLTAEDWKEDLQAVGDMKVHMVSTGTATQVQIT